MNAIDHQHYMQLALTLAENGRCTVSPNPMVGCVIVKEGTIVGTGFHQRAGEPHAERLALDEAGQQAQGATAYVTLEPCCHQGRTPPCTEVLIQAGIQKVYVATVDPNPLVGGKGILALQAAGIAVDIGLCETQAVQLNEIFFHYIKNRTPFVFAKWAMSLDGKTITHAQDTRDISGSAAQHYTHHLRQQVDAIIIGANTARYDNPMLTVRFSQEEHVKQPMRIIITTRPLPLTLTLFSESLPGKTMIVTSQSFDVPPFVELVVLSADDRGRIDIKQLLLMLGERGVTSILLEGGQNLRDQFIKENSIQKSHVYVAPYLIGDAMKKQALQLHLSGRLESDFHFTATREGM
ncbi:MAG TPA: bifunctional diaminohydroxyphosphoribosylaminopyrimidine deaminase/5-amino-6-(5-phosphoribosylamino)uracil reductase RibD [Gammaproteobacteria bacterium]|jgi:diaminohydroxyphosphoribosylaminopyrimidine deaminase/5-amino-6-(5-phosphoribosylamino)uracil reductase|nr:bifunctional diaminohydroxyphosphoribosylaminopyrimidine deaminase/5-amino-6-(5-phosphoribosylamino)uracil reductase RibD [Gammaproteobacteria bacterium]